MISRMISASYRLNVPDINALGQCPVPAMGYTLSSRRPASLSVMSRFITFASETKTIDQDFRSSMAISVVGV